MSPRDRIVVMVVAVAVVVGGAWFGLVAPQRAASQDLTAQVEVARGELAIAHQQTAQAVEAQKSLGEDTAAVATLGKAVPGDDHTASLLYQLDAAAGDSKVRLQSITPATTDPSAAAASAAAGGAAPAGVTELSLTLEFSGRFLDLQRFLRRVHDSTTVRGDDVRVRGRLLSIRGINLTPGDEGSVKASVQAVAYVAAPAAAAPAPAPGQPTPEATASMAPPTQPAMIGAGG